MPLKELSVDDQIRVLEELDEQEKLYDKNLALAKGDSYSLKYKHNIDVEPGPLQMLQEVYRQQPMIEAIKSVSDQLRIKESPLLPQTQSEENVKLEPLPETIIEDKETMILKKHNIPTMKEVDERNLDVADVIVKISHYNKSNLGVKLATLTRSGRKDSDEYQAVQAEIQVLKNYKNKLLETFDRQRVMIERLGQGMRLKIGKYYADLNSLKRGVLKIRKKNKAKVNGIDDMIVGEGVKQLLLKRFNPKAPYSDSDIREYSQICAMTGHAPKQHSKIRERIYITTVVDAQRRLVNALGEIKAGNNNPEIFNEVVGLADFLLGKNKLTKDEYKHLIDIANEGSHFLTA